MRKWSEEFEMDKLVSIIIPVYNVEMYLAECIESVLKQTYQNLEILLIDDGSTDSSGKICDEYAQKDTRIKVIHKENGGVSLARNVGLDLAQGEYITFIDSDDFVEKTYVEKMYNALIKNDSDLVFCRYANYINGKIEKVKENFPEKLIVDNKDKKFIDFISSFFNKKNKVMGSAWRILYKKELIANSSFNINIKISEDLLFVLQTILTARRINFINDLLYFYRFNKNSAVHSYKKNYLQGQLNLYYGIKEIFQQFTHTECQKVFQINSTLLCHLLFSNELKFKQVDRKKNIVQIRKSELYKYFKLKNGLRLYGIKRKMKFLIVWCLVKTKLV